MLVICKLYLSFELINTAYLRCKIKQKCKTRYIKIQQKFTVEVLRIILPPCPGPWVCCVEEPVAPAGCPGAQLWGPRTL